MRGERIMKGACTNMRKGRHVKIYTEGDNEGEEVKTPRCVNDNCDCCHFKNPNSDCHWDRCTRGIQDVVLYYDAYEFIKENYDGHFAEYIELPAEIVDNRIKEYGKEDWIVTDCDRDFDFIEGIRYVADDYILADCCLFSIYGDESFRSPEPYEINIHMPEEGTFCKEHGGVLFFGIGTTDIYTGYPAYTAESYNVSILMRRNGDRYIGIALHADIADWYDFDSVECFVESRKVQPEEPEYGPMHDTASVESLDDWL
jgi:hypothetical protein